MSGGKFAATANKQAGRAGGTESRYSNVPPLKRQDLSENSKWRFGFGHFQEMELFGLDSEKVSNRWMMSMMERLAEMGRSQIADYQGNSHVAQQARYHPIDWNGKAVPITLDDLNWLPSVYRDNQSEFPISQFQVSTGTGRVIGFFDETWTFQVVLLDPLHNAQPSKSYGYSVDHCSPIGSELHALQKRIDEAIAAAPDCGCGVPGKLKGLLAQQVNGKTLVVCLHQEDVANDVLDLLEMIDDGKISVADIFKSGVDVELKRLTGE